MYIYIYIYVCMYVWYDMISNSYTSNYIRISRFSMNFCHAFQKRLPLGFLQEAVAKKVLKVDSDHWIFGWQQHGERPSTFQTVFISEVIFCGMIPNFISGLNHSKSQIWNLMEEIWCSPVEVGSWNPIIYKALAPSQVVVLDFFHQQYQKSFFLNDSKSWYKSQIIWDVSWGDSRAKNRPFEKDLGTLLA